jgi:hypothetical protein
MSSWSEKRVSYRLRYARPMSEIRAGQLVLFYLFEVAETADLQAIPRLIAGPAVPARLAPKPATPAYVQYEKPPVSFDGEAIGIGEVDGFRARFRVYDYGVVSVALIRPFEGAWSVGASSSRSAKLSSKTPNSSSQPSGYAGRWQIGSVLPFAAVARII